ncbi:hypothetical protein AbraIFM66951_006296 [Aspergillus brasiliensis]|uniref:Uncharacterized protein n=1 Tax=Aspergillus brasiliensis TaxID=319629 RepID=A0A9W6DJB8_9EURO|nr:hypothetical protein AbraCBS73388_004190 [Aspergillus brasiliensis]GKZ40765.1 hypothetical protein AbraIFM66951_006296 [Aspergillus brasiliensis]
MTPIPNPQIPPLPPLPNINLLTSSPFEQKSHVSFLSPRNIITSTILKRSSTAFIPGTYNTNGLSPGAVAGVIIGSVLGFIFILYLIFLALGSGRRFSSEPSTATSATMSEVVVEEEGSSVARRPPRRSRRREVVEEEVIESGGSRRSRRSRAGRSRDSHIVVEESVTSSDPSNVVEVEEEHSSVEGPGGPHGRRTRRRSRPGHYRAVDPLAYGGLTEDESLRS